MPLQQICGLRVPSKRLSLIKMKVHAMYILGLKLEASYAERASDNTTPTKQYTLIRQATVAGKPG